MLTPAEQLGLAGLSLATRVRKAFFRIPEERLVRLTQEMREEARRRRIVYVRDGQEEVPNIMLMPLTVLPEQLTYLHYVSQVILNALKRLSGLYLQDMAVREVLRLTAEEESWLEQAWGPALSENDPIFGRLDALVDFISPMWKDSLKFIEPNLSGIGGLHMIPTAEAIFEDLVAPLLAEMDEEIALERGRDVRELLIQEMMEHLQVLGRESNLCLVEPKYVGYGPEEQQALAGYYRERHGLEVMHADPAELRLEGSEVTYEGRRVDLVYRDYSVFDLIELERQGKDVRAMKELFKQNRVVSSITAELDQKSCWEVLTDSQFTQKHFSAEERQVFKRHILWTRLVSDRRTTLPDGRSGGLLRFLRAQRERLVLKPNRAYGGEGVVIGHFLGQEEWDAAIDRALGDKDRWVAQELASIPVSEFPVIGPDGKVHFEPFYTVMGFAATRYGLAVIGRASQKQVVNIAQRGGIGVVMTGRPPHVLHGPRA